MCMVRDTGYVKSTLVSKVGLHLYGGLRWGSTSGEAGLFMTFSDLPSSVHLPYLAGD